MKKFIVAIMILLFPLMVFGQQKALFTDEGYIQFKNDKFFILFVLVNDLQASVDAWKKPETPTIYETTKVKMNEPISLFILYTTMEDAIDLTYNFRIRKPNETFSDFGHDGLIISNTVIKKGVLYPANTMPTMIFDEKEETGVYYYIVQLFNHNEYIESFILKFNLIE